MKKKEVLTNPPDAHFTLRIPKLQFKDTTLNVYLVFTLIIFAFILGMLTNKVLYLENQVKNPTANANVAPTDALQPTEAPAQIVKVDNGHLPILGNKDAKVTVVEFSDLQCPFCKRYIDDTHDQIKQNYIDTGKIKFVFRHFPLTTIHPNAYASANAAECANEQGKFWDFHDLMFKNQDTWTPQTADDVKASFISYAGQLGMNTDQFATCITSEKYKKNVDEDMSAGQKVQVDGTPAFFVNGYRLTGAQPFSEFEKTIDQELKK